MSDAKRAVAQDESVAAINALYTELALRPDQDFGWGKGKQNAGRHGYDAAWLDRLPDRLWESAAAVGNPFALGPIHPGETVVDLGCGAGADACIAALLVGNEGRVIGVDVTPAMVAKARDNARLAAVDNLEIHEADMTDLPVEDACAHVVISNGSINLTSHKLCVFQEIYRVLRPGGRLQFADMVRDPAAAASPATACESWADCVSGTVEPERYHGMLAQAGFTAIETVSFTGYRTAETTVGATFRARKP